MLVLFDQGTPVPMRTFLVGHTVETAAQRGWDKLRNGELLEAAEEAGFEVLGNPRWPLLFRHVERVAAAVNAAQPGSYTEVEIPAT